MQIPQSIGPLILLDVMKHSIAVRQLKLTSRLERALLFEVQQRVRMGLTRRDDALERRIDPDDQRRVQMTLELRARVSDAAPEVQHLTRREAPFAQTAGEPPYARDREVIL